jgi:O-antigen ligase
MVTIINLKNSIHKIYQYNFEKELVHRLFPWITGAIMSTVLVMPSAYAILTLWLTLYGLWFIKGFVNRVWRPSIAIGASYVWYSLAIYVLCNMVLGLIYGYKASYYEAFIPFLMAPFIVNAVLVAKPSPSFFWMGAVGAAFLAGLMGSYQSLYLGVGRSFGAMNNVIIFGDLSVVMAMFSVFGLLYWSSTQPKFYIKLLLIIGTVFGVWASLLSGTKGGWLSILMITIMAIWISPKEFHWPIKILGFLIGFGIVILAAYLAPHELVIGRIKDGLAGAQIWFATGSVTDGSVSIRLEKWHQAVLMLIEKPLTGWGNQGAIVELQDRITAAGVPGVWTQAESDLLQAGINHGLPGIFSILILYFGFILFFVKMRRLNIHSSSSVGLSSVAILFIILMIEFGLSVNALGRNAFRHTFIVWEMLIFSLLLLECTKENEQKFPT